MNKQTIKSILAVKSCAIVLCNEMDSIKSTPAYSQRIKNLTNNLFKELDAYTRNTYKIFDDEESEIGFQQVVKAFELFKEIVEEAKTGEELVNLSLILESFKSGTYKIVDGV